MLFGADALQKGLFNVLTDLDPEIPVSWIHFLPEGRAVDVFPSSFVSPSFHIRCSWEPGFTAGVRGADSKGLCSHMVPARWIDLLSLQFLWFLLESWTELSLPLWNNSGLSLRTPKFGEIEMQIPSGNFVPLFKCNVAAPALNQSWILSNVGSKCFFLFLP